MESLEISKLDSPEIFNLSKISKSLGKKKSKKSVLKLFALKSKKKLSEKLKLTVTKLSFEDNSRNKTNAELFLKFKSIEYFNGIVSFKKNCILEFINSTTLNFLRKKNFQKTNSQSFLEYCLKFQSYFRP